MFNVGMPELIVIFLVVLLLFGGSRLVDIAKGLGAAIREFKKSVKEDPTDESKKDSSDTPLK
jgi:sec-independent protein translocase protein TatA